MVRVSVKPRFRFKVRKHLIDQLEATSDGLHSEAVLSLLGLGLGLELETRAHSILGDLPSLKG